VVFMSRSTPWRRHTLKLVCIHTKAMEWVENTDVMKALDDLVNAAYVAFDAFMISLSRNNLLLGSDYSTMMIIIGLYGKAYTEARPDMTREETHEHAMQFVANHPISQRLATQATTAALGRVAEVEQ